MKPATTPSGLSLCRAETSQLLIVDVQERLVAAMADSCLQPLYANLQRLTEAARRLGIPLWVSEQYPQGLGPTQPQVSQMLPQEQAVFTKTCFSCCAETGFAGYLAAPEQRPQVILTGMETHICVLQTAAGLQALGYEVFVIADAVCSRREENKRNGLERMAQAGIHISNTESLVFEWLVNSQHPEFRALSRLFR
ncbi:MAG: isochorismatase family protein [Gammaproteobacteria bacterium]|nr:isochorismatase family protein [Gammaproteobacteria bacterium]